MTAPTVGALGEARLAGNGQTLSKRCNTAGERFPARPKGATQIIQYCVTALEKGLAIPFGLCLILDYLGSSEHDNIILKEY